MPWLERHHARRLALGREDPARARERFGEYLVPRPDGPLIWLHAASVGESGVARLLAAGVRRDWSALGLLVTTGTRSAAGQFAANLEPGMWHAYAPYDVMPAVSRFLDHWRPDLAIFIEQELWPGMLGELDRRGIPRLLCNGRISPASWRRWHLARFASRRLLRGFALVLAASPDDADRLASLGASEVRVPGNLKFAAPSPEAEPAALASLAAALGAAPRWLAASIHAGEEAAVVAAHRILAAERPGLVTLVAPRHPDRGEAIAARCRAAGIPVRRHGLGELPPASGGILVADTLGEMGLWHRLSPVAFLGGSLAPAGGHNPAEAAGLGAALLVGPGHWNFSQAYRDLIALGAALPIADGAALAQALAELLAQPQQVAAMGAAARRWKVENGAALARTLNLMAPWLDRLAAPIPDNAARAG
ncbi:MAG: 3-deoxy-D-manno-octulosonic acid transferase [Alphaproteobacteria bacterium]|nr:3-deoxy-D-manno-octulosonic acid transferase [Alphaproteobacteria bacterium]